MVSKLALHGGDKGRLWRETAKAFITAEGTHDDA